MGERALSVHDEEEIGQRSWAGRQTKLAEATAQSREAAFAGSRLKRQACRGSTQEFTIDSTLKRGSRWDVVLPRLHLPQTSTRSPRARSKARFITVMAGSVATPLSHSGGRSVYGAP